MFNFLFSMLSSLLWGGVFYFGVLALVTVGIYRLLWKQVPELPEEPEAPPAHSPLFSVGMLQSQGTRPSQQDSWGCMPLFQNEGILALAADGLSGLKNSDILSARVTTTMQASALGLTEADFDSALPELARRVNEDVGRMLGQGGLGTAGSTLGAVLALRNQFHWLTVGDTRIYLFRGNSLIQLTRDHNVLLEMLPDIDAGLYRLEDAWRFPRTHDLTSYFGVGVPPYVDVTTEPVELHAGEQLLIMTNGVYNAVSESVLQEILTQHQEPQMSADLIAGILQEHPDAELGNLTLLILRYNG